MLLLVVDSNLWMTSLPLSSRLHNNLLSCSVPASCRRANVTCRKSFGVRWHLQVFCRNPDAPFPDVDKVPAFYFGFHRSSNHLQIIVIMITGARANMKEQRAHLWMLSSSILLVTCACRPHVFLWRASE